MDIQHYLRPVMQEATMARIATICAYLLVLLLAYNLAELTWRMLAPAPDRESAPSIVKEATANQIKPDSFARTIAGLNLFGYVDASTPPTPVVRETRLNLVLRGVMATHGKNARAIIYSPSGSDRGENPYSINAKLPGGATLKEIHSDYIVLLHNGRHETLRLPKKVVATGSTGHNIANSSSNRPSSGPSTASTNTQKIREYRDALIDDPVSLIGIIRSAPYREDGKLIGYRVQTGRDKDALNNLGLLPGDIVTSVNGVAMGNSTKLMKLLKQISKAEEVSAEVIRDGSPTTVSIRLDN
ncbi:MAG: type II secretion system protein GspC [Gammaproteobacteria bacterium]|nr:type II secretion system protein GspC [Gammaproteobacteria bacterium]